MIQEQADRILHYPELYDKLHNVRRRRKTGLQDNAICDLLVPESLPAAILQPCVTSFLRGQCGNGHFYAKALVCGKEWCPDCGKDGSAIHLRRQARWWGKIMQMKKVGYLVFTIPKELRESFHDREALKEFRKYLTRKLQRMGYARGLSRYHWAGKCPICEGHGCAVCRMTGCDTVYKPHLNVLIEEGYLTPERWAGLVDVLKEDIVTWFNQKYKGVLAANKLQTFTGNVFYSYCGLDKKTKTDKAHRIHKLKYITRATFRHFNSDISELLKGFRTTSTWGKWKPCDQKRTSDLVRLEASCCPQWVKEEGILNEKIHWGGFIGVYDFLKFRGREHIEAGYFLLNSS